MRLLIVNAHACKSAMGASDGNEMKDTKILPKHERHQAMSKPNKWKCFPNDIDDLLISFMLSHLIRGYDDSRNRVW